MRSKCSNPSFVRSPRVQVPEHPTGTFTFSLIEPTRFDGSVAMESAGAGVRS
jgi:hypothetical protein